MIKTDEKIETIKLEVFNNYRNRIIEQLKDINNFYIDLCNK